MSREDSQFKLRMPASLREAVEESARDRKRSVNAEIVSRLELSLIADQYVSEFLSAERIREIAELEEKNLPKKLRDSFQAEILLAAKRGASGVVVSGEFLGLAEDNSAHDKVMNDILKELRDAGYDADRPHFFEIDISF